MSSMVSFRYKCYNAENTCIWHAPLDVPDETGNVCVNPHGFEWFSKIRLNDNIFAKGTIYRFRFKDFLSDTKLKLTQCSSSNVKANERRRLSSLAGNKMVRLNIVLLHDLFVFLHLIYFFVIENNSIT